jgi:acyl CoA:acetate/3-ketoacid CoA transferase beta subunit
MDATVGMAYVYVFMLHTAKRGAEKKVRSMGLYS